MNRAERDSRLHEILKKHWGYDSFRPLQLDIINSILDKRDTIGLMPTGGGKSITFQVPALLSEGLTIVITPLISLMKNQVDALRKRRIKAVYLYSGITSSENRYSWDLLVNGRAKFLYCSPERLKNERFCKELEFLNISQIIIDEAHCISQWGYDFRPDYLNISKLRKIAPHAPVLALTATATPQVVDDIADKSGMKNPRIFRTGFSRPNLSYIVRATDDKEREMLHILNRTQGSAIIYVRSRKRTRLLSSFLNENGLTSLPYHAGMDSREKQENQTKWMSGEVRVIVATNAFGMGIDKPDVRVVIHHDTPSSLEEYYQEAGRAGRDGLPAYAVLLSRNRDKAILRRRLTTSFPPKEDIKRVYELVCTFLNIEVGAGYNKLYEFEIDTFCRLFKYKDTLVRPALNILTYSGLMQFQEEIDMQSRVLLTASREELYHLNNISQTADNVLTAMLRTYTGLFTDYAYINEVRIGEMLGVETRAVYESLLELSRAKVLSYIPRRRVPYIYIPTAREETRYIKIPKTVYQDRQKQAAVRIESMIDFAFNSTCCRVARVLKYFGESDAKDCGQCDVCRKRKAQSRKPSPAQLEKSLLVLISSSPDGVELRAITDSSGEFKKEVLDVLRSMVIRGIVRLKDGIYTLR